MKFLWERGSSVYTRIFVVSAFCQHTFSFFLLILRCSGVSETKWREKNMCESQTDEVTESWREQYQKDTQNFRCSWNNLANVSKCTMWEHLERTAHMSTGYRQTFREKWWSWETFQKPAPRYKNIITVNLEGKIN